MVNNTPVVPFLSEDPVLACGVEFGLPWARMRNSDEPVAGYLTRENQDQILPTASRLGWTVRGIRPWDKYGFFRRMEKGPAPVR